MKRQYVQTGEIYKVYIFPMFLIKTVKYYLQDRKFQATLFSHISNPKKTNRGAPSGEIVISNTFHHKKQ